MLILSGLDLSVNLTDSVVVPEAPDLGNGVVAAQKGPQWGEDEGVEDESYTN